MQLGAVLGREGDIGQHVVLAVVHQSAELGPAWPQLIGDVAPGLLGGRGIGLQKGLTDRGGDHGVLALRHVRQGVAHPMNSAPLPCRTEHPGNRMAQAVVWGWNGIGQLGDATTIDRHTPVQVKNLSGVTAVDAGQGHNLALKSDGTVWGWGLNCSGELGDGTTIDRHTPVQVQNLSGVTCVASGDDHSLALKSDGTVWTWGRNMFGELGDGTITDRHTSVQGQNLGGITAVAAGAGHSVALKSDGTVWTWGRNGVGQLGDGTTIERHTPVRVLSLSGVTAIAAQSGHSLALRPIGLPFDGIVQAWGCHIQ